MVQQPHKVNYFTSFYNFFKWASYLKLNAWIQTQVCLFDSKPVFFTLNILINHHNPQVVRSVPKQPHFPSEKREVMICFASQSELGGAKIMHTFPLSIRCFSSRQTQLTCYIMNVTLMAVMGTCGSRSNSPDFWESSTLLQKWLLLNSGLAHSCLFQATWESGVRFSSFIYPRILSWILWAMMQITWRHEHESPGLSLAARTPSPGSQQDFMKRGNITFYGFPLDS